MRLPELKLAMHAAWAAGFDSPGISWLLGAKPPKRLVRDSLEGYIFENPTHVIIAFQGTDRHEWGDLWADLNVKKVKLSGVPGLWHEGFVSGAGRFWPELLWWLRKHLGRRKLIVTGFSLGAALAQATSIFLSQAHIYHTVYSFGGPRIATRRASKWLEHRTDQYRIACYDDPVTLLPPSIMGFRHTGEFWTIGPNEKLSRGGWARILSLLLRPFTGKRHGHHREKYLLLVRNL